MKECSFSCGSQPIPFFEECTIISSRKAKTFLSLTPYFLLHKTEGLCSHRPSTNQFSQYSSSPSAERGRENEDVRKKRHLSQKMSVEAVSPFNYIHKMKTSHKSNQISNICNNHPKNIRTSEF